MANIQSRPSLLPMALPPVEAAAATESAWMVLCTKSRQEKRLADHLARRGVDHYLPLIERVTITRGRKFRANVPLFPGYVFLRGEAVDRYVAIDTGRVCNVLAIPDQERFMHELVQIRRAVSERDDLELHPFAVEGRRCRVTRGPLMGLEGVVCHRTRHRRLVLQIDVLGRGAALEIDLDLLEPVSEPAEWADRGPCPGHPASLMRRA